VHELGLTESIVQIVRMRLGDERVVRVRVEVGRLMAVEPDALRFCFAICSEGTSLAGAALEIDEVPARASCRGCGVELELSDGVALCHCGSADLAIATGNELRIKEVEVA
jgi:hydrogenase nickel incorporation protein HypA/HybF